MATSLTHPVTSSDVQEPPSLPPAQLFEITRATEEALSRLLMAFVTTGLMFMVFPGTFLGVWNLLQISGRESVASISPAWLQAHGHAQVFGWVGSFILGIGFYSIPKMRGGAKSSFGAFLIFFRAVSQHRPEASGKEKLDPWIWVVISASLGLLLVLVVNLGGCLFVSFRGTSPAFPHLIDQCYLALMTWGFLVPFVWGFSAKWITVFLGLKPLRTRWLLAALVINFVGLGLTVAGAGWIGSWLFVVASAMAVTALRMFEPSDKEAKIRGVHSSFPFFVRMAYVWLVVAAILGVAATRWDTSGGIWGASRHALTVGFVSIMILSVGQRILPAFAGMRMLWSTKLMFTGLLLVTLGCTLRVTSEIIAYQVMRPGHGPFCLFRRFASWRG